MKCFANKSAIAKHAWMNDHPTNWADMKILQRANRAMELVLKESLSILTTPEGTRFNQERGMSCLTVKKIAMYK